MLNRAQVIGFLGQDPDVRYMSDGTAVANLSIATTEKWKDKNGQLQEQTEWHRANAWGKTAEVAAQYLKKGSLVYVEGKLQTRKWTDKQGVERYTTEIRIDTLRFLDRNGSRSGPPHPADSAPAGQAQPAAQQPQQPRGAKPMEDFDDDIPFIMNALMLDPHENSLSRRMARYGKNLLQVRID